MRRQQAKHVTFVTRLPVAIEDDESRDNEGDGHQVRHDGVSQPPHVDLAVFERGLRGCSCVGACVTASFGVRERDPIWKHAWSGGTSEGTGREHRVLC